MFESDHEKVALSWRNFKMRMAMKGGPHAEGLAGAGGRGLSPGPPVPAALACFRAFAILRLGQPRLRAAPRSRPDKTQTLRPGSR
jgi:hypothetical protein